MKEMSLNHGVAKTGDGHVSHPELEKSLIIPAGQKTTLQKPGGMSTVPQDMRDTFPSLPKTSLHEGPCERSSGKIILYLGPGGDP